MKFSIVLVGECNVGKSSLFKRYKTGEYQDGSLPATIGVDACAREVNGYQFEIFDTAGQEKFKSVPQNYYRKADGVILVFDVTNRESFDKIIDWRDEVLEHANENPVFLLIGNKCDDERRVIQQKDAQEMAEDYSMAEYIETSAKDGTNVEKIFETIARMICEGVEDTINIDQRGEIGEFQPVNSASRVQCKC